MIYTRMCEFLSQCNGPKYISLGSLHMKATFSLKSECLNLLYS